MYIIHFLIIFCHYSNSISTEFLLGQQKLVSFPLYLLREYLFYIPLFSNFVTHHTTRRVWVQQPYIILQIIVNFLFIFRNSKNVFYSHILIRLLLIPPHQWFSIWSSLDQVLSLFLVFLNSLWILFLAIYSFSVICNFLQYVWTLQLDRFSQLKYFCLFQHSLSWCIAFYSAIAA